MHAAFTERIFHPLLFPSGLATSLHLERRDSLVQTLAEQGMAWHGMAGFDMAMVPVRSTWP